MKGGCREISDCMSKDVQIAQSDQTIRQAAEAMARLDAGVMPVREHDRLVSKVTDRDIAIRGVAMGKGPDTVADCYFSDASTIGALKASRVLDLRPKMDVRAVLRACFQVR
jgi:predicted transcriptional regulator